IATTSRPRGSRVVAKRRAVISAAPDGERVATRRRGAPGREDRDERTVNPHRDLPAFPTTSSLEFSQEGAEERKKLGLRWAPKRAWVRGSSQRFTSRRSRSTPIGDRRRRSPF